MNHLSHINPDPCTICQQDFDPKIVNEVIFHKPSISDSTIDHKIHLTCLNSWLERLNSGSSEVQNVGECPLCKKNIEPMRIKAGSAEFNDVNMGPNFVSTVRLACQELQKNPSDIVTNIVDSGAGTDGLLQYANQPLQESARAKVIQWALDRGLTNLSIQFLLGGPISQTSLDSFAVSAVVNSEVMLLKIIFENRDENSWADLPESERIVSAEAYGDALEVAMRHYQVSGYRDPNYQDHEAIFQFLTEPSRVSFYFPKISILTFKKLLISAVEAGCGVVTQELFQRASQNLTENTYSLALEASFEKLDSQKERREIHSLLVEAGSKYPTEFARIHSQYTSRRDSSGPSQDAPIGGAGSLANSTSSSSSSSSSNESSLGRRPRQPENSSSSSISEPAEEPGSPSLQREAQRRRI